MTSTVDQEQIFVTETYSTDLYAIELHCDPAAGEWVSLEHVSDEDIVAQYHLQFRPGCLIAEPCKQEEVVNVFEVLQLPCVASADPAKKN